MNNSIIHEVVFIACLQTRALPKHTAINTGADYTSNEGTYANLKGLVNNDEAVAGGRHDRPTMNDKFSTRSLFISRSAHLFVDDDEDVGSCISVRLAASARDALAGHLQMPLRPSVARSARVRPRGPIRLPVAGAGAGAGLERRALRERTRLGRWPCASRPACRPQLCCLSPPRRHKLCRPLAAALHGHLPSL